MTAERYHKINSLVDVLLDTAAEERPSVLEQACAGDAALRREVEAILVAHESQDDFLQAPVLELIARDMASDAPQHEYSGRVIGGYQIMSRLGAGGIGEVWLAHDKRLARQVALKLLAPKFTGDPHQVMRFKHEARAASQLNHPNIVTIHEIGEIDGLDFIAQEFVDGVTVRQQLAAGAMPIGAVLEAGGQVAAAMSAAHKAGIIHRDLKPENLIIRKDGLVKVLDFGLARFVGLEANDLLTSGGNLTLPGLVLGTVRYMSPEQARGLPLDQRSDIFSLGVVLYEMATGAAPFSGPTPADTLASILSEDPPPIASLAPNLPAEFERVVRLCLEKDREHRYANAEALAADLKSLAERLSTSERLVQVSKVQRRQSIRRPEWRERILVVGLVAVVLICVAAVFMLRGRMEQAHSAMPFGSMKISRMTLQGTVSDAAIAPDGKEVAYVRSQAAGEGIWLTDLARGTEVQLLAPEMGGHSGVIFSPDSRYLYYRRSLTSEEGTLCRVAIGRAGEPVKILDGIQSDVAISPDGRELAFVRVDPSRVETELVVMDADGRNRRQIAACRRPEYFSRFGLAWSPDKQSIICFAGKGRKINSQRYRAQRVRVADGHTTPISPKTWEWVQSVLWPANTDSVLVNAGESAREDSRQIWKLSLKNGEYSKVTNDLNSYQRLSITSDGKVLSAMQSQVSASLWLQSAQRSRAPAQISTGDIYGLESLAWVPGERIAYTAVTGDYRNIWITDTTGSNATQVTTGTGDKAEISATRDGRYFLYKSEGNIWRVNSDGRDARQLTNGAHDVHPTPTANGREVIYASFVGWSPSVGSIPRLWKVSIDGGKAAQLRNEPLSFPQVSPDGQWIACSYYPEGDPRFSRRETVLFKADGSGPLKALENLIPFDGQFLWNPKGREMTFSRTVAGAANIWQQRPNGGPATQVTNFTGDEIFNFAWSADAKWLAMVRGKRVSNAVLIRDF